MAGESAGPVRNRAQRKGEEERQRSAGESACVAQGERRSRAGDSAAAD